LREHELRIHLMFIVLRHPWPPYEPD
jgi:hypothetical protein